VALVIIHIEPEDKLVQLGSAIHSGVDSLTAEHAVLGYTHIDAGMMLALHWRLPKQIRQFIEQHHDPEQMDIDAIAKPEFSMVNHLAHLVLQQLVPASQPHVNGIWQSHKRISRPDSTQRAIELLQIPLHSPTFFRQLQTSVERLKIAFPDLFPPA